MKRILAIVMAMVLCLSFCACGKGLSIGENVEKENISFKLTDVQIADSVKYTDNTQEDFLTPDGTGELEFKAPGGSKLLYFTAEFTYTGSEVEDSDIVKEIFVPIVKCKGGRFDTNFMIVMQAPDNNWYNLNSDLSWETRQNAKLDINSLSFDLEPGESTVHQIRGFIYIPAEAAESTNSKINLYLDTTKFSVR